MGFGGVQGLGIRVGVFKVQELVCFSRTFCPWHECPIKMFEEHGPSLAL